MSPDGLQRHPTETQTRECPPVYTRYRRTDPTLSLERCSHNLDHRQTLAVIWGQIYLDISQCQWSPECRGQARFWLQHAGVSGQWCGNPIPMVVTMVPQKKKALARSQLVLNVALVELLGSIPTLIAFATVYIETMKSREKRLDIEVG